MYYARHMLHSNLKLDHQMKPDSQVDLEIVTATECRAVGHDLIPAYIIAGKRRRMLKRWIYNQQQQR